MYLHSCYLFLYQNSNVIEYWNDKTVNMFVYIKLVYDYNRKFYGCKCKIYFVSMYIQQLMPVWKVLSRTHILNGEWLGTWTILLWNDIEPEIGVQKVLLKIPLSKSPHTGPN